MCTIYLGDNYNDEKYGDTNSTLAGAITASKLNIPIIHIEAGLRSFNMKMPEEQNRILTDHVSSISFCPTKTALDNLKKEGITKYVHNVGDVMCDAVIYYSQNLERQSVHYYIDRLNGIYESRKDGMEKWFLATIHRAENTDKIEKIAQILDALQELPYNVIFPVHPRIQGMVHQLKHDREYSNIYFVRPMGYLDMLYFTKHAEKVITDSGGLQKETYILNTPYVTVRNQTEWLETLQGNHNILAKPIKEDILNCVLNTEICNDQKFDYYGNGHAAEKICQTIIDS